MTYTMQSTGTLRTTIYTMPDDRTRLAELARQVTLANPGTPDCTMSEAVRIAVEYTLSYGFGIGEEGPG